MTETHIPLTGTMNTPKFSHVTLHSDAVTFIAIYRDLRIERLGNSTMMAKVCYIQGMIYDAHGATHTPSAGKNFHLASRLTWAIAPTIAPFQPVLCFLIFHRQPPKLAMPSKQLASARGR